MHTHSQSGKGLSTREVSLPPPWMSPPPLTLPQWSLQPGGAQGPSLLLWDLPTPEPPLPSEPCLSCLSGCSVLRTIIQLFPCRAWGGWFRG